MTASWKTLLRRTGLVDLFFSSSTIVVSKEEVSWNSPYHPPSLILTGLQDLQSENVPCPIQHAEWLTVCVPAIPLHNIFSKTWHLWTIRAGAKKSRISFGLKIHILCFFTIKTAYQSYRSTMGCGSGEGRIMMIEKMTGPMTSHFDQFLLTGLFESRQVKIESWVAFPSQAPECSFPLIILFPGLFLSSTLGKPFKGTPIFFIPLYDWLPNSQITGSLFLNFIRCVFDPYTYSWVIIHTGVDAPWQIFLSWSHNPTSITNSDHYVGSSLIIKIHTRCLKGEAGTIKIKQ